MSLIKPDGKPVEKNTEQKEPPHSFVVEIEADKPDMKLLPGGLWVLSIPFNAKVVTRTVAIGWAYDGLHRVIKLLDGMEAAKLKSKQEVDEKSLGIAAQAKAVIDKVFH